MTFLVMSSATCCRHQGSDPYLVSKCSPGCDCHPMWLGACISRVRGDRDSEMMEWWCVRWESGHWSLCFVFVVWSGSRHSLWAVCSSCYNCNMMLQVSQSDCVVTKPESCNQSQESSEQCTGLDFYNSEGLRQEFGSAWSEPIVVTIGG